MLTRRAIVELVGAARLDDHTIVELVGTGATQSELVEALNRVTRGGEVGAEKMNPMTPRVRRLCEILQSSALGWDDTDGP